mmetsp:Transcript_64638/g.179538  ORF Transcript_64638/g.179538 Transcript_64638/m.179538 type:complete len:873 (+) Transcript_64638:2717-5335(+)
MPGSEACAACQAGSYATDDTSDKNGIGVKSGATSCAPCPKGKFSDTAGSYECRSCEAGETSTNTGSAGCTVCPAGAYSRAGSECEPCEPGKYAPNNASTSCFPCDQTDGEYSSAGASWCDSCGQGYYMDPTLQQCKDCPRSVENNAKAADCKRGTVLENITVLEGFYRFSRTSAKVYECPSPELCSAEAERVAIGDMCLEGSEGPLCSLCISKYYHDTFSDTCIECGGTGIGMAFSIVTWVVLALVAVAIVFAAWAHYYPPDWAIQYDEYFKLLKRQATIVYVNWQIVTALQEASEFQGGSSYPYPLDEVSKAMEVVSLDLFNIFHLDCAEKRWRVKLVTTTMTPIALWVLAVAVRFVQGWRCFGGDGFALDGMAISLVYKYFYFFLPVACKVIFASYTCKSYDLGPNDEPVVFLAADMNISCDSEEYKFITAYASLMVVALPIGVQLGMYLAMREHKVKIENRITRVGIIDAWEVFHDEELEIEHLVTWFGQWEPKRWSFAFVDMSRRILFTSLMFAIPSTTTQLQLGFLAAVATTYHYRESGPAWDGSSDHLHYYCRWNIVACVFSLAVMQLEGADSDAQITNQLVTSCVVLAMNVGLVLTTLFTKDSSKVEPADGPIGQSKSGGQRRQTTTGGFGNTAGSFKDVVVAPKVAMGGFQNVSSRVSSRVSSPPPRPKRKKGRADDLVPIHGGEDNASPRDLTRAPSSADRAPNPGKGDEGAAAESASATEKSVDRAGPCREGPLATKVKSDTPGPSSSSLPGSAASMGGGGGAAGAVATATVRMDAHLPFGWTRGGGGPGTTPLDVERVTAGKQAEAAGVRVGFRIIAVDRVPVSSTAEFETAVEGVRAKCAGQDAAPFKVTFDVPRAERGV